MKKVVRELNYKWKTNSRVKAKPSVAAVALEKIRLAAKKSGTPFRPELVVTAAKAKRHPLHKEFEWDDAMAAHTGRIERARYIIRSLEITIVQKQGSKVQKSATIKHYTSLGSGVEDGSDSEYHDTQEVLSDTELREQVLMKIWRQLLNLKSQYKEYTEFAPVWEGIEVAQRDAAAVPG